MCAGSPAALHPDLTGRLSSSFVPPIELTILFFFFVEMSFLCRLDPQQEDEKKMLMLSSVGANDARRDTDPPIGRVSAGVLV